MDDAFAARFVNGPIEGRRLGAHGPTVSFLGFGSLEIGRDWGLGGAEARRRCDEPTAVAVVHKALQLGVTCFDTARAYHRSEERLGLALEGRRQDVFLATKCGEHSDEPDTFYDFHRPAIRRSIDQSLHALRTDRVDLLQIHWGPPEHEEALWAETVPEMQAARDTGKTRLLGASCPTGMIGRCLESKAFDVLQVSYNLLDRGAERGVEAAAAAGVGILVRDGLGAGRLSPRVLSVLGQDEALAGRVRPLLDLLGADQHGLDAAAARLPALALAFLRRNPAVGSVLVGTKSVAHLEEDVAALAEIIDPGLVDEAIRLSSPR
jgi:aryl-alcohol dehydrogenase-like predicted oxidoreductase